VPDGLATASTAFDAYLAVRDRLPPARPGRRYATVAALAEIADPFDLVLLDAYGVLNVGERPVPGAAERIAGLRRAGRRVAVVTNSAGYPKRVMMARYARLGFDFAPDEVASSREALLRRLSDDPGALWGLMLSTAFGREELEQLQIEFLENDPAAYARADGFLLVGSEGWSERRQALLEAALLARPRPVLVGNPDIVAPREEGLTLEPGHFAHRLANRTGIVPEFFGKPFPEVFELALSRLPYRPPPERVLMVGDTLHTDVLGAKSLGFAAALVTGYGSLAGADVAAAIRKSGIVPDFVAERL
jgi:glycerol-1-phosphatase